MEPPAPRWQQHAYAHLPAWVDPRTSLGMHKCAYVKWHGVEVSVGKALLLQVWDGYRSLDQSRQGQRFLDSINLVALLGSGQGGTLPQNPLPQRPAESSPAARYLYWHLFH